MNRFDRILRSRPRGQTLIELVAAMASATVLITGLGATVIVTSGAFRPESTAPHATTTSVWTASDLLADLRLATGFTERTDTAATFTVPDRNGDGQPETLRYAWSGNRGDPLTLSYNGAEPMIVARDVQDFSLNYVTHALPGVDPYHAGQ